MEALRPGPAPDLTHVGTTEGNYVAGSATCEDNISH